MKKPAVFIVISLVVGLTVYLWIEWKNCTCCPYSSAEGLFKSGDLASAAELYQEIVKKAPGNVNAEYCYARVLHTQGKLALAKELYSSAATEAEQSGNRNCFIPAQFGKVLLDLKEYDEATVQLRRAESLCPGNSDIQRELAWLASRSKDFSTAKMIGERLIEKAPDDLVALENLIYVELQLKDYGMAQKLLDRLKRNAQEKEPLKVLKAQAYFLAAHALDSTDPELTRNAIKANEEFLQSDPINNATTQVRIEELREHLSVFAPPRENVEPNKIEVGHWVSRSGKVHYFFDGEHFHFCEMFSEEVAQKLSQFRGLSLDKTFCGKSKTFTYSKMVPLLDGQIQVFRKFENRVEEERWEFTNRGNRMMRTVFYSPPQDGSAYISNVRNLTEYLYYEGPSVSVEGAGLRFIE